MAYFLDNYPVSDESLNLVLTEEQEKFCRVVYKLDDEGGADFSGLWNPDAEYSDEYVIVPLRSTGCTPTTLDPDKVKSFANVIGSNSDTVPGSSSTTGWLLYWRNIFGIKGWYSDCSTDGKFYFSNQNGEQTYGYIYYPKFIEGRWNDTIEEASCSSSLVGGHIILGAKEAEEVVKGGPAYIVPICCKHNISHANGYRWGEGFYMKLKCKTKALKLTGYLTNVRGYITEKKHG